MDRRNNVSFFRIAAIYALISLTALSLIMSPVYVLGQSAGEQPLSFYGWVVDEYGYGMGYGVEIKVYSSDGSYVLSESTNLPVRLYNGYFDIYVAPGDYIIHFLMEGYVEVTKSASFRDDSVSLGTIVLRKALKLSSTGSGRVASPGDKLTLPFTVANIGGEPEMVEFSVTKPENWSTRIKDQIGEITKVNLSPSASMSLQLEITIPRTSTENGSVSLTAVGKTNSTVDFAINLEPLSNISIISCQFVGKVSSLGNIVKFQVRLSNSFWAKMQFRVSVESIPQNWTAYVKNSGGEKLTGVTLDSDEFVDLVVEVTPSDTAKIGEYGLLFKVKSYDGNLLDSLPLDITLIKGEEEAEITLTVKFPEMTIEAGKALQYPATIINTGSGDGLLSLSVEPPANWKVVFKSGASEVSRLNLEAGKSESLVIEATPPSAVNIGTYQIPVQVKSDSGAVYAETSLKATIVGSYDLDLTSSTLLTSATTGGSATFTVRVTNSGQSPVTSISVSIAAPSGWDSSTTPTQVGSLKPNESSTFTVVVKSPGDAVAGDYMVTLTGKSDKVNSDSVQVRVTVTAPTSWGLIGVGIAAVMVFALLFVFIRFRRR